MYVEIDDLQRRPCFLVTATRTDYISIFLQIREMVKMWGIAVARFLVTHKEVSTISSCKGLVTFNFVFYSHMSTLLDCLAGGDQRAWLPLTSWQQGRYYMSFCLWCRSVLLLVREQRPRPDCLGSGVSVFVGIHTGVIISCIIWIQSI